MDMPEIRLPPSRGNSVPQVQGAAKYRLLLRIMKDQAAWLANKSQPSEDFGAPDLAWYFESADKRTRNLEYMYRNILNHCAQRKPLDDIRALTALTTLIEGSRTDAKYRNVKVGLPNWFTTAVLLWITMERARGGEAGGSSSGSSSSGGGGGGGGNDDKDGSNPAAPGGGNGKDGSPGEGQPPPPQQSLPAAGGNGAPGQAQQAGYRSGPELLKEVLQPFVFEECKPQVLTLMQILEVQLIQEEFFYLHIQNRPSQPARMWICRLGVPPLPIPVILALLALGKEILADDAEGRVVAVRVEKSLVEVVKAPRNPENVISVGGGAAPPPPQGQQGQQHRAAPAAMAQKAR